MNKISDSVLKSITEKKVQQLPGWYHRLQTISLWGLCLLSILFGALSLSYLTFIFFLAEIPGHLFVDALGRVLWIPITWFVLFLLFVGSAIWAVEKTKGAYRIHMSIWILGNILVTLLCTAFLFLSGAPHHWEQLLYAKLPEFSATRLSQRVWEQPRRGMLQGRIRALDAQKLSLETREGEVWTVYTERAQEKPLDLEKGLALRILGKPLGENQMEARRILPIAPKMKPFILPPRGEEAGRGELRFGK